MENEFLQSLAVLPCSVLNRELRPFSAWHASALMMFDSPFLRGAGAEVTRDDLVFATFVCTTTYPTGMSELYPKPDIEKFYTWGDEVGPWDFEEELYKLDSVYLKHYLSFPKMWEDAKTQPRETAVPWPFYVVSVVLQHSTGIIENDAWNMPISRLGAHKASIAEAHGAILLSERQKMLLAFKDKIEKDAVAEKEVESCQT